MKSLTASPLFDFTPHLDGYSEPYILGAETDGTLYCCAARTDEPRRVVRKSGASGPRTKFSEPTDYIVLSWDGTDLRSTILHDELTIVSEIQPHPDGVLLTAARCRWRPEEVEKNALVVNWKGEVVRRATFGDGIRHVRTSPDGNVFVGYFDEGVFGNYGWGGTYKNPDGSRSGPTPIGRPGLVSFDARGTLIWEYDWRRLGRVSISAVYAMNVTGDNDVWGYFYLNFDIVNVKDGEYRRWISVVDGAMAMAVDGDRILLVGDYEKANSVRILRLGDEGACALEGEVELVDDAGDPVSGRECYGVGKGLYAFQRGKVSVLREW